MNAKLVIVYEVFGQEYPSRDEIKFDYVALDDPIFLYEEWQKTHVNKVLTVFAVVTYDIGD